MSGRTSTQRIAGSHGCKSYAPRSSSSQSAHPRSAVL